MTAIKEMSTKGLQAQLAFEIRLPFTMHSNSNISAIEAELAEREKAPSPDAPMPDAPAPACVLTKYIEASNCEPRCDDCAPRPDPADPLYHLQQVSRFIRHYPILPSLQLRQTNRGLSVGKGPTQERRNPWSLYQELANHIDDYIAELAACNPAPTLVDIFEQHLGPLPELDPAPREPAPGT